MKSASEGSGLNLLFKIDYSFKLLKMRLRGGNIDYIIPWDDINEYKYYLAKYSAFGKDNLNEYTVLEIGYGARPWRLFSLASMGVNIHGIDIDRPTYGANPARLLEVLRQNGFERFSKSLVRGILFDRKDISRLRAEFKVLGKDLVLDESRLVVGNAAEVSHFSPNTFTFAFSEDVFEHIPVETIPDVLSNLKGWLQKDALLLIRPHVYTGISGGHDPDCYPHKINSDSFPKEKAWSHLLNPDFKINTFLNKLRLHDYIKLFSKNFEILEMKQKYDSLGKEFLTEDLRKRLIPQYSEEELLTNQVLFVLRA
ncbi:class I SAM-dependent methyltransferase [Salmonirosea aquatica]|uniref:Class I SAM-dependent methyltransferase n=1 Tax=Salmonirosea aquatica TaxID=2654236 RepID=A0A7C9FB30_9BACT|nr:class I SAM-dependent methyltransferase [Cytophagaceae bacterium SJW1-29]